ncbi:MAG: hypothetical protein PVSMB7_13890 [Chloroflexota bacterium]
MKPEMRTPAIQGHDSATANEHRSDTPQEFASTPHQPCHDPTTRQQRETAPPPAALQGVDLALHGSAARLHHARRVNPRAVLLLSQRLIAEYGYKPTHVQVRCRYHGAIDGSRRQRTFPIDIAVFEDTHPADRRLSLVVDCGSRTRAEGLDYLRHIMNATPATIGIWFNGNEYAYLGKHPGSGPPFVYSLLPNIPGYGQTIGDVGRLRVRDLATPSDLHSHVRDILYPLQRHDAGITGNRALLEDIVKLTVCKIHDEMASVPNHRPIFQIKTGDPSSTARSLIVALLADIEGPASRKLAAVDDMCLSDTRLAYIVGQLQIFRLTQLDWDYLCDAIQLTLHRGRLVDRDEVFTPLDIARLLVDLLDPQPGDIVIDPACGVGTCLMAALRHVWKAGDPHRSAKDSSVESTTPTARLYGMEEESFHVWTANALWTALTGQSIAFWENALAPPASWDAAARSAIPIGQADVVLTNPWWRAPSHISQPTILQEYDCGHRWTKWEGEHASYRSRALLRKQSASVLLLERCLHLLKPGGRMGIVLPEAVLGPRAQDSIVKYVQDRARILETVPLPYLDRSRGGVGGRQVTMCLALMAKRK